MKLGRAAQRGAAHSHTDTLQCTIWTSLASRGAGDYNNDGYEVARPRIGLRSYLALLVCLLRSLVGLPGWPATYTTLPTWSLPAPKPLLNAIERSNIVIDNNAKKTLSNQLRP